MKHKKLFFIIIAILTIISGKSIYAKTPLDILVNGSLIKTGSKSFIEDGNAMIPLRVISEVMGCDSITWNENTKEIKVTKDKTDINIKVGNKTGYINNTPKKMATAPQIHNDTTFINARFISEALDAEIFWNEKTHTVIMEKKNITVPNKFIDDSYTQNDLSWLAKIVHAEAQGEIENGKIAVANVILNRRKSNLFPDNIYDVIFDRKHGVQFTPTANGTIHNIPSKESFHAAKKALFGENIAGNSLYFLNPEISTSFWIVNNRTFHKRIGNHDFYL